MDSGAQLVSRDSPAYREFARLYRLAQSLRPTGVDRWNGELWATQGDRWGGFHPGTGRITLSGDHVLRHLVNSGNTSRPGERAQALATVLHEATHAGMPTDAPSQPNAVRSEHSLGVMEGLAEIRALEDFEAFAHVAGYSGLAVPEPQYPAAHAAVQGLLEQASGPRKTWNDLIDEGTRGPGVMHFDQLADGVLRNRLHDVVPDRAEHRLAVRAALIEPMMHQGWILLKELDSAETGLEVARNIRSRLDAKVDEIQRHYRATPGQVFPAEGANAEVVRLAEGQRLAALPPPDASSRVVGPKPGGGPELRGTGPQPPGTGVEAQGTGGVREAQGTGGVREAQGTGGGSEVHRAGRGPRGQEAGGEVAPGAGGRMTQGAGGGGKGRSVGGGEVMRFLDGQAPAAGATGKRPRLGMGERGAGQGRGGQREVEGPER